MGTAQAVQLKPKLDVDRRCLKALRISSIDTLEGIAEKIWF
jgi:hypothetical protein